MLNPKHILITGASSGIGAALAVLYAAPGVRLSLHGRSSGRLMAVAATVTARGAECVTQTGSVTDAEALAAWITACDAEWPLDLVIANAGISGGTGGGGESDKQARAIFATNLTGVMNTVHPVLPLMAARHHGQVAVMSSLAGFRGFAAAPAYCASKAAVRLYGEALRGAYAGQGVAVNVICPGFVKTPMTDVNPFPMPFMVDAEQAALIIRKGLERNVPRIAFPWPMVALVKLMGLMPQFLFDQLGRIMPKKPALD